VSSRYLTNYFSEKHQVQEMPSDQVNVQSIAFCSLTNVNNKQNTRTRIFVRVITQQTLSTEDHTAYIADAALPKDTGCDTTAMRWRYGRYDTSRASHTGGDPLRNKPSDEDGILVIWWMRRRLKKRKHRVQQKWWTRHICCSQGTRPGPWQI
jgi:hypothetical protein